MTETCNSGEALSGIVMGKTAGAALAREAVPQSGSSTAVKTDGGALVARVAAQPPAPIVLYEFEACPFCRLVREAFSALHLDVEIRPCPKGGERFRPEAMIVGASCTTVNERAL